MFEQPALLTAMVTPFDDDGIVSLDRTTRLIEHLLTSGTEGLVVAGTTGESPTLSQEEKLNLFQHVLHIVNKRVPVIAATGSNNTKETIAFTQKAELLGVDGIMLVTPYYNKPSQQGMYHHFSKIAKSVSLPIMLYNIPGRSVVHMTGETIIKLSQIDNIVSLKEASGDLNHLCKVITGTPSDFKVYCGEDSLTLPMLAVGSNGVVSVASHVIGGEMKAMMQAFRSGDVSRAAELHKDHLPLMETLFAQPSPAPVKAALDLLDIPAGHVRLPLESLIPEQIQTLKTLLH